MRKILNITLLLIGFLAFISCKPTKFNENEIYERISGAWTNDLDGSPTLYLISDSEDFNAYFYTYPFPVEEEDAGLFYISGNELIFENGVSKLKTTYTFSLSSDNNTLILNNLKYNRIH